MGLEDSAAGASAATTAGAAADAAAEVEMDAMSKNRNREERGWSARENERRRVTVCCVFPLSNAGLGVESRAVLSRAM
jgi:hypothetical protein